MSTLKRSHPGITERAAKIVQFRSVPAGPHEPRPRRQAAVVGYLRVNGENRVTDGREAHDGALVVPVAAMRGRILHEANDPALCAHWSLALEQARELRVSVPITYEWRRGGEWVVRTATFVPRERGIVDIYVRHLGTRPAKRRRRKTDMRKQALLGMVVALMGCATASYPRRMTQADCTSLVAHEMGYDVMPDGTWRARPGTVRGAGNRIEGAGARIDACVNAGSYYDAQGAAVRLDKPTKVQ